MMLSIRNIRLTALFTTLLTLFLVGLGGFVRATGAGLACPDWPLCYGRVIPPGFGGGVFQEVFHRYIAGIVSVITFGLGLLIFHQRVQLPRLWKFYRSILLILAIQVVLGGLTVLLLLNPFIVTSHLALGTLFFVCWGLIATDTSVPLNQIPDRSKTRTAKAVLFLIGLTFFQLLLGGFVGSSGAALACPDLPFCGDGFLPDNPLGVQVVHMAHRTVGVILLLVSLGTTFLARRDPAIEKRTTQTLLNVSCVIVLQIAVGISNVYLRIPVDITVTHLVLAELILLTLLLVYRGLNPSWRLFPADSAGAQLKQLATNAKKRASKIGNF